MTCPVIQMPGQTLEEATAQAERAQYEVECFDELPAAVRQALSMKVESYTPSWALRQLEKGLPPEILLQYLAELPNGPEIRPDARRARHPRRAGNTYG